MHFINTAAIEQETIQLANGLGTIFVIDRVLCELTGKVNVRYKLGQPY